MMFVGFVGGLRMSPLPFKAFTVPFVGPLFGHMQAKAAHVRFLVMWS
jgi:hypothetical protein